MHLTNLKPSLNMIYFTYTISMTWGFGVLGFWGFGLFCFSLKPNKLFFNVWFDSELITFKKYYYVYTFNT